MKVSFVSSGPGDPELLTLKAVKRIQAADVILYDDLSAGGILDLASGNCDLIGVGKRAGRPSPKQNHLCQLLLDYARSGARTVRLKSGDAGLFGRLEEEIMALDEAGIAYEIIPGVASPLAAVAALGIPLTRRHSARRVQFITGHDVLGELPVDLNIKAIADPLATTVVFMGKRTFGELANKLIKEGMQPTTPVLVAENVSKSGESFAKTNLGEAQAFLAGYEGDGPAVIIYGPLAVEFLKI